jgi:lipopolysaccharide biosynthesis glycosyltransferase
MRLPFGVGRTLQNYDQVKARLTLSERSLAEQSARDRQNAKRYALAYRRLMAAAVGRQPAELGIARTTAPPVEASMADRDLVRLLHQRGRFVERLQAGEPLEAAVAAFVRERLRADDHLVVRSLCQSLQANPATRVAGYLGSALVAARMQLPELAWACFQEVPTEVWRRLAPGEYFRTGFRVDSKAAVAAAGQLLDHPPSDVPPRGWVDLAMAAFGAKEEQLAGDVLATADALASQAPTEWAPTDADRDWLRPWIGRALRPAEPPAVPGGHVSLAVLDYKQPDQAQTSTNIGDYVQTLACLGHLARYRDLRFHGASELVDVVTELRERVRPGLRLATAPRDVTLTVANRDASSYDAVPENTWALVFGWYMQSTFGRYDFPLNPALRPILVSFHCNRPDMLTPAAIDYLRRYGPVGCRDWTTVHLLLGRGVPAFFSGCLTTTVNTVFPELGGDEVPAGDAPIAYVDVKAPPGAETVTQESTEVRHSGLAPNLRRAIELLEHYRRRYSSVVTSRLHCYLPARSIGMSVEFRPHNPADIRFTGLTDLTEDGYAAIQSGLLTKLERVLGAIFAGGDEREIYAIWRDQCAPEVAQAEARHASVPPIPPPSFDIPAACALVRATEVTIARSVPGPGDSEVHVALALDGNLKEEMKIVVTAMVEHSAGPLHLWILCRDHESADFRQLAALFPTVSFTWLPCDDVDYGPVLGMLQHITVSTMDRLLLPDLLPELDRIVYHDIDALPLADVGQLYQWDLQGQPLAARSAVARGVVSGFANVRSSTKRLRDTPAAAYDCIRRVYARHGSDYAAFNAGILVLDLARMRSDQFGREFIPFVEQYGMNDQEVLNCYAGPNRAVLPAQWNSFPTQEVVENPKVIHWAGPLKPWKPAYVLLREEWAQYVGRLRDRETELAAGG